MRLWMIADQKGHDAIMNTDGYVTRKEHLPGYTFFDAYKYMADEMKIRVPNRGIPTEYPIWAWYNYVPNTKKRKPPDLRCSGFDVPGSVGYRFTLEIPDDQVLLSLFDEWSAVFCNWYLPYTEKEDNDYHIRKLQMTPEEIEAEIRKSWSKIFDLDMTKWDRGYMGHDKGEIPRIQATFWNLYKDEIVDVQRFIVR